MIAHRGASFYAPENTMPAFQKAVEMKADLIELDVLLTRDKMPVVFHDEKLKRTTNGVGPVNQYFYRELQELDAGSWFNSSFKNTRIPTLQTILRWSRNKIALNIEIKGKQSAKSSSAEIETIVLDLIRHFEMMDQIVISSFSSYAIKRVKNIEPAATTSLLNSEYSYGTRRAYRRMLRCKADGLNMKARQMKRRLMEVLNRNNIPVWIYTVNEELAMRNVIRKGATGIFTDRPDLLRKVALDEFLRI